MELFRFIIETMVPLFPRVCFHFGAGDLLDEEMLSLLATVWAMQMEIGLQSFNPQTLATINRKTDPNVCKGILRSCGQWKYAYHRFDCRTAI